MLVQFRHGRANEVGFPDVDVKLVNGKNLGDPDHADAVVCLFKSMDRVQRALDRLSRVAFPFETYFSSSKCKVLDNNGTEHGAAWRGINDCRLLQLPRQLPIDRWYDSGDDHEYIHSSGSCTLD